MILTSRSMADSCVSIVRRCSALTSGIPVIVLGSAIELAACQLAKLAIAGATHAITLDCETTQTLRAQLEEILLPPLPEAVFTSVTLGTSGRARSILRCALLGAVRPLRAGQLANWFGVSERTCNRRLEEGGLGSLRDIIGYSRAVRAVCTLVARKGSLAQVAAELAFPGTQAVRMLLRRRLRIAPRECRADNLAQVATAATPRARRRTR